LDLFRIAIPPLRERGEDIARLAGLLIQRVCDKHRLPARSISAKGQDRLRGYAWPGNVRELAHELERAIVFEEGDSLDFAMLNTSQTAALRGGSAADWLLPGFRFPHQGFSLEDAIDRLMHMALDQADQNVSAAARLLGVPRDFIRYRLGQKSRKPDGK
jgi:DNA-binding NtrC family response regulator